ncbi:MAG: hypoxanthine phosphoribosyltransferase [Desulfomonilaceae bacterium]
MTVKKRLLFDADAIAARVKELGLRISNDFPEGDLLLVGILKGAFIFLADLSRAIGRGCQIDFARLSSYGSGTETSGVINVVMDIGIPVKDKNVILVDDIVDTGLTLHMYRERVAQMEPRAIRIAALINKTSRREKEVKLDYFGFEIESGFVVGYGLDWDERFRNLPSIYAIEQE